MNKSIIGCWCNKRHKSLYPILRNWIKINKSWAEIEKGGGPWGDTERSSIGIFAGAVWKSKYYAFEEYHYNKRNINKYGKLTKGKYKGRIDIYFNTKDKEYIGEAKRCYPDASFKNASKICLKLNKTIESACSDIKKIYDKNKRRISVTFVNPYFELNRKNLSVMEFVNKITGDEIECDAMAWVFPAISRETNIYNKMKFPGTAIIIKEIRKLKGT